MTKPSARSTIVTICFDGDKAGYGCTDTEPYTTTGVHETMRAMTSTWQYGAIAWSKPRSEYHLVIKDPGLGGTPGGKPATDFVPTMMRIVMTVVPPGGTYTPPASMGGMMTADGGTSAAPDAGSAAADGPAASADAASGSPDATRVDPTPAPDAGGGTTPRPTVKPDASAPPKEDPTEEPPAGNSPAKKSGGCAVGGGSTGAALPLVLFGLLALQRRARRRRP
jgi:hypothetical protein